MKEPKYKTRQEVTEAYRPNIDSWIVVHAFNAGYKAGYDCRREEMEKLRALCHREAGEHDAEYSEKRNNDCKRVPDADLAVG